jgi:hypothetical protein
MPSRSFNIRRISMNELLITVQDMTGLDSIRPVTGGVPIAEGAAPPGIAFHLRDGNGRDVPLQTSILARWKDGSARWVLLDFQSQPPPSGRLSYVLSWGDNVQPREVNVPVCQIAGEKPSLRSGDFFVSTADDVLLNISDRVDVLFSLTDAQGRVCDTVLESAEVETAGRLRSTLSLVGSFYFPSGGRWFQFRLRASVYAGLSMIRLEPLILIDAGVGVIQKIRELKLTLRSRGKVRSVRLGGDPGWEGTTDTAVRLFQYDDEHYRLQGAKGGGGKAPGWAEFHDEEGPVAAALRDFWQQWPKSLEVSEEGISIGLLPRFEEGDYAHMEPWYKYQYLFEGDCYRLRTGQARRWDIWVDLNGDGESLAKMANAPLIPVADPAQAIATGVWDAIAPAGIPEMVEYDAWAENLFNAYCRSIEAQRDYGAMNWGDWFGERKVNWGNHEYDTTNQLLIQFARTGDPKYFYVADAAARHSSEVDTVHHVNDDLAGHFGPRRGYPARAGMVHQHTVGHVSGFYPAERIRELFVENRIGNSENPYLCLDPYNLGHIWTQGLVRHYFLTGDPFLRETVEKIGVNLARLVEDREYQFMGHSHCGRTTGWPLLALAGAYEIDLDERYLNAMKTLVDDALAEQDPVCGGWLYSLPRGHCYCEKRKHVGMAGFITAILINGLSRYYLLTGDKRLPQAIDRAVTFLDNDTWREEWRDWRYTSCPASRPTGQPGVVVMAHVNGVRITDNPEHLRVLRIAWEAKFRRLREAPPSGPGFGKGYTSRMYGCAEAAALLAAKGLLSKAAGPKEEGEG